MTFGSSMTGTRGRQQVRAPLPPSSPCQHRFWCVDIICRRNLLQFRVALRSCMPSLELSASTVPRKSFGSFNIMSLVLPASPSSSFSSTSSFVEEQDRNSDLKELPEHCDHPKEMTSRSEEVGLQNCGRTTTISSYYLDPQMIETFDDAYSSSKASHSTAKPLQSCLRTSPSRKKRIHVRGLWEEENDTHVSALPDLLLLDCLEYLSMEDLCRCGGVSKRWRNLSCREELWDTVDATRFVDLA